MEQNKILCFTFNQDSSCLAIGTESGFSIFNLTPFKTLFKRNLSGEIGIIEMLGRCNILAFTGGGKNPKIAPNKVIIWNDAECKAISELRFISNVQSIKLKKTKIFVICQYKIYTFSFQKFEIIDTIETLNPNGIVAVALDRGINIIAYPSQKVGEVSIKNYDNNTIININAHQSEINALGMNIDGSLLATASKKGTLIRIFNSRSGSLLQELRRGSETADIYCLAFDKSSSHLACSSNRGTIHIFNIRKDINTDESVENTKSIFAKVISVVGFKNDYLNSEWSFAQFRLNFYGKTIVTFSPNDESKIIVFTEEGNYYLASFDTVKGGECIQEEMKNILNCDDF